MATDPDRQGNGRPSRADRRALNGPPGGLHGAFQVAWALAMVVPLAASVSELTRRPGTSGVLEVVVVSGVWALVALAAWIVRIVALSSCGPWGARTRHRIRARNAGSERKQ